MSKQKPKIAGLNRPSRNYSNSEVRDLAEALSNAEKAIGEASIASGYRWKWAPYSRPNSGGPFLWNDIIVIRPDGSQSVMPAEQFIEESLG